MKLLSTVAAGALLLAGCAPFEHGHYEADSHFINDFGDRAGTPVLYDTNSDYAATATTVEPVDHYDVHSAPAPVYSAPAPIQVAYAPPPPPPPPPVQVFASAPLQQHYVEPAVHHVPAPIVHSVPTPAFPHEPVYHEPVRHEPVYHEPVQQYVPPPPPVVQHYEPAPPPVIHVQAPPPPPQVIHVQAPPPPPQVIHVQAPPPPIPVAAATSVSVNVNVDGNRYDTPTVVAPRQVVEERYIGETRYAQPEVVNMPPVYMRNGQQYSNQPFPAPGIPQFGAPPPFPAPGYGFPPPAPQNFGYPAPPPAFGGGYGRPMAANMRPYQNGFNGGFNTPYGGGCVTQCVGSSSVF